MLKIRQLVAGTVDYVEVQMELHEFTRVAQQSRLVCFYLFMFGISFIFFDLRLVYQLLLYIICFSISCVWRVVIPMSERCSNFMVFLCNSLAAPLEQNNQQVKSGRASLTFLRVFSHFSASHIPCAFIRAGRMVWCAEGFTYNATVTCRALATR